MRSSKNFPQRGNRRRGFDDDNFYGNTPSPPPSFPSFAASAAGPEVKATVKWFNPEKGFGFVELSDGSGDVFLHVNALHAAGVQTVSPGATLQVRVGQGQKGRQVNAVTTVDESTADPSRGRTGGGGGGGGGFGGPRPARGPGMGGGGGGGRRPVDLSTAVDMTGTVKWYNPEKGFGFITPQEGGKDVFVHATALERAGIPPLHEGQSVQMRVVQGAKGPEVGSISV